MDSLCQGPRLCLSFFSVILNVYSQSNIMAPDHIHLPGSSKEKGDKEEAWPPEVPLGMFAYISLARMQSCDLCTREAGKPTLFADWPCAQLNSVLLLQRSREWMLEGNQ